MPPKVTNLHSFSALAGHFPRSDREEAGWRGDGPLPLLSSTVARTTVGTDDWALSAIRNVTKLVPVIRGLSPNCMTCKGFHDAQRGRPVR